MERLHSKRKKEHPVELKRLKQAAELSDMDVKEIKALSDAQKAELKALEETGKAHYAVKGAEEKAQGAIARSRKSYKQIKSSYKKVL